VKDDSIYYCSDGIEQLIITVNDIPITFGGAAKHNIHNALAVVALSFSLGLELKDIVSGLSQFSSTPEDNPGRGNLFEIKGFKVILDFAHNEHGLSLMAQTINNMPANRRLVMLGQAGDRTDELIEGLVKSALKANPDVLLVCELEDHLRGRNLKEVPELIHDFALKHGLKENQIIHVPDTIEGTNWALNWAQPEDLMLILGLDKREEIVELLESTQQSL
jgi:UDP-N-acetylmuramyl tripeptide synthase